MSDNELVKVTVRMPEGLRTKLRIAAAKRDLPIEVIVQRAVQQWLEAE